MELFAIFLTKFEPVSLQTQIHLNVQTKASFKILRVRNCLNSENTKNERIWTKNTPYDQRL